MPTTADRRTRIRSELRPASLTALGAAAALALSGCGSTVPDLEDVWPEVRQSIEDARSVAVSGQLIRDGQSMGVDIAGQIDDSSYRGAISSGDATMDVVGNEETTYIRPDAAFYDQSPDGARLQELVGERWLRVPAEDAGFTLSTLWDSFSQDVPDAEPFGDSEYTSERVEHNGEEVYKYTGTTAEDGEPVAVLISPDNTLVRVEFQRGGPDQDPTDGASPGEGASPSPDPAPHTGAIDIDDFNAVEPVEMPADEDVLALPGR